MRVGWWRAARGCDVVVGDVAWDNHSLILSFSLSRFPKPLGVPSVVWPTVVMRCCRGDTGLLLGPFHIHNPSAADGEAIAGGGAGREGEGSG